MPEMHGSYNTAVMIAGEMLALDPPGIAMQRAWIFEE